MSLPGHGAASEQPPSLRPRAGDAFLIIDVQNDFLPGGALPVPQADAIIPVLNRCILAFEKQGCPIFATRDWHPVNHCSFRAQGGPWPPHCVAGSRGAAFAEALALPPRATVVSKGTQAGAEAYSGFQGTELADRLRDRRCSRLVIGGLATDYCVRATALDGLAAGFAVAVLLDGVRAVDVAPQDGDRAIAELTARGVRVAPLAEVLA